MTRLLLISDIHMRDRKVSDITRELDALLDIVADTGPDHVFVLGDLIEDSDSVATDRSNIERIRDRFEKVPSPVTYLLGNHDVENLTHDALSNLLGQDRFYGTREIVDTTVVFLDSTLGRVDGARGALGPDQRAWLDGVLPDHEDVLVLCHHPLGNFDISDNEWFKDYPEQAFLGDRKETLGILAGVESVRGTISGHIHQTERSDFRGMPHASINAFSKEVPEKPLTGTYAEVRIDDCLAIDVKVREDLITSFTFA